jgi:hypothetical protein
MQTVDQVAEWLVRWKEAVLAHQAPPALDQLPAELHPRAREDLRLLRGFARMAHGLSATGTPPPSDTPPAPPDTPRYRFEAFLGRGGMGEVWRGCDTLLVREVALKVLREQVFGDGGPGPGSRRRPITSASWSTRRSCPCTTWASCRMGGHSS